MGDERWAPPPMGQGYGRGTPPEPTGRAALYVWAILNVLLVAWILFMAWWPQDEYHPALGVGEGLANAIGVVGLLCLLTIPGSLLLVRTQVMAKMVGALLVAGAGFLGFVLGLVIGAGRCETCDCA